MARIRSGYPPEQNEPITIRSPWLADIATDSSNIWKPSCHSGSQLLLGGKSAKYNRSVQAGARIRSGQSVNSYKDDFYDRIHIVPLNVDVGNLTSEQFVTVEVFNGYLINKTLATISQFNADGITITGDTPPVGYKPLQSKIYELRVTTDGPPDINAIFRFLWNLPEDTRDVTIVGSRIVAMPYIFESPMQETLEWKTQLFQSNNGSEQRVRLRKAPRQRMSVNYPLPHAELQRAFNLAYGWLTRRWAVPLWSEAQQIEGGIPSGTQTITIDTQVADFRVGGLIIVWQSERQSVTAKIVSMTPTTMSLDKPINQVYPSPWVAPVRIGRVLGNITRRTDGYSSSLGITYEFTDNIDLGRESSPVQYLGNDVLTDAGMLSDENEVVEQLNARVDVVDYGTGVLSTYSPWQYNHIRRTYRVVLQGLDEIWEFRKWLHSRAGRIAPFWKPTFENNIRINQNGIVTFAMTVEADNYKEFGSKHNHIAIHMKDGRLLLRTVLDIATIDSDNLLLNMDESLNADASEVGFVSFVTLHRLDADRIELNWQSNRVLVATVPIMEISP